MLKSLVGASISYWSRLRWCVMSRHPTTCVSCTAPRDRECGRTDSSIQKSGDLARRAAASARVIGNWFGFFRRFSDQGLRLRSAGYSERHANMLTLGRSRYLRKNPGLSTFSFALSDAAQEPVTRMDISVPISIHELVRPLAAVVRSRAACADHTGTQPHGTTIQSSELHAASNHASTTSNRKRSPSRTTGRMYGRAQPAGRTTSGQIKGCGQRGQSLCYSTTPTVAPHVTRCGPARSTWPRTTRRSAGCCMWNTVTGGCVKQAHRAGSGVAPSEG